MSKTAASRAKRPPAKPPSTAQTAPSIAIAGQETPTGGEKLIRCLEREGVEIVFGLSGGAAMPIFDALVDSKVKLVLTRHDQPLTIEAPA